MSVGSRMKQCRKALGLSAEYVAEQLHVSAATIYRYEKGDIDKMPGHILEPLANILSTTPAYLMGWEEEAPSPQIRPITDAELKFALFDGDQDITDAQFEEVKRFAQFIRERDRRDK